MRRHLRPVPPSPSPSRSEDQPPTEQEARAVHDELAPLRHAALFAEAVRVARDYTEPSRHRDLTPEQWTAATLAKAGDVARHVFDASVVGHPRDVHYARKEIARLLGLCLVLDDALAALEDHEQGA